LLDPTTGALRYACAGHPPPMVIHSDGSVDTLDEGRSPLLAAANGRRPEAVTALPVRARLLLYTDGLIERRTSSLDVGFQRLADAARSQRGLELEDFCDAVLAEMLSHEPIADDVAILCVERLASGDRHSA
jgi:serine phosphatase RsbU (regulator of sigma subunit)